MLFEEEITYESIVTEEVEAPTADDFEWPEVTVEEASAEEIVASIAQADKYIEAMEAFDGLVSTMTEKEEIDPASVQAVRIAVESTTQLLGTTAGLEELTLEQIADQPRDVMVVTMEAKDSMVKRVKDRVVAAFKRLIEMIKDLVAKIMNNKKAMIEKLDGLAKKAKKLKGGKDIKDTALFAKLHNAYYVSEGKSAKKIEASGSIMSAYTINQEGLNAVNSIFSSAQSVVEKAVVGEGSKKDLKAVKKDIANSFAKSFEKINVKFKGDKKKGYYVLAVTPSKVYLAGKKPDNGEVSVEAVQLPMVKEEGVIVSPKGDQAIALIDASKKAIVESIKGEQLVKTASGVGKELEKLAGDDKTANAASAATAFLSSVGGAAAAATSSSMTWAVVAGKVIAKAVEAEAKKDK